MSPSDGCKHFEIELSALVDGEFESEEIPRALEHLRECPSCDSYFQRLVQLERASEALRAQEPSRPRRRMPRARPAWSGLRQGWIAAAIVLAFFAGWMLPTGDLSADVPARGEVLELSLGEDAGKMADAHFVSMAVELLRADPRYHLAMFEMLQDVVVESPTETLSPVSFAFPR